MVFHREKILHLGRELEVWENAVCNRPSAPPIDNLFREDLTHLGTQSKQGKIANVFSICNLNGE